MRASPFAELTVEVFSDCLREMELCSLEDAFPDVGRKSKKGDPSKEERRAARKAAKRCKGPALEYLLQKDQEQGPDPDRPALKRLGELPPFTAIGDAFADISGSLEGFKLPRLPASNVLFADQGLPAYFGKGEEDEEGFTNMFQGLPDLKTNTSETFEYVFGEKGVEKAGSGSKTLPGPELDDNWKPITAARSNTAFFSNDVEDERANTKVASKRVEASEESTRRPVNYAKLDVKGQNEDRDSMQLLLSNKLKELEQKLAKIESNGHHNSKNEILLFVGTGLFLLVSFDFIIRASRG